MQALGFNGPWDMTIMERPDPIAGEGEVLIEVIATGICGSDVHGYSGETGRRTRGQVMGHETVGRVAVGSAELSAGTLVTVNPIVACGHCEFCLEGETQVCPDSVVIGVEPTLDGSFAGLIAVPARNVVALEPGMPVLHGALVEPLAVGYHAVMRADPSPVDRMLIIGGGPIGQAAALGARRAGVTAILVSEPVEARRELLEQLGFATTSPELLETSVTERLGGKATAVVDAVGIAPSLAAALQHSTTRARVVLVGMGAKEMSIEPYGITVAERVVIGSYCYSEAHFASTAQWVGEGHPELDLLIDRTLALGEGPDAFKSIADGSGGSNKTLLLSSVAEVN
ncbi:alcohol dehydrogenase catalytic domain-containing protein [Leifsonia sp. H3M29-4]|uniref:zinc-dependent alcohol dehydrogenase n=1 Tax=Salinibacterium metalliresistens TaxID=3031321 RepID=UPI0023DCA84F|nr:alcohol dehydrogenase catalytic domain-containing protein [Salinibacterium metalliresistens]MDF1478596.1 alcohol dehydrogenase catalytic domain-containing protein [Salinibacterium metalliresistens]